MATRGMRSGVTLLLGLALLLWGAPLHAQPRAVSVTISGGVSLISYESGVVFYLMNTMRRAPGVWDPRVFTGSSAGSINATVAALSRCRAPERDPTRSLAWRVVQPLGMDALFVADKVQPNAVFTRDAFVAPARLLEGAFAEGLDDGCEVLLGINATRVRALQLQSHPLPPPPRMVERFVVRITGAGAGQLPRLTNHVAGPSAMPRALLPLDGPAARPFAALQEALFASTAFPVAFAPQPLGLCLVAPGEPAQCTPATAQRALFMDGGFFDNQPIGMAVRAMKTGVARRADGTLHVHALTDQGQLPDPASFIYVDPSLRHTPTLTQDVMRPPATQLLPAALDVGLDLAATARTIHLDSLLQNEEAVRERLVVARGILPKASDPLSGFLGFFEEEFRAFDFALGMLDGRRLAQTQLLDAVPLDKRAAVVWPEDAPEVQADPVARRGWRRMLCAAAVLDREGPPRAACQGEDLADFRILLQYALERFHDECQRLGRDGPPPPGIHPRCLDAMAGAVPPRVPYVDTPVTGWASRPGETELDHMLRRLAHHRFLFRDMGLTRDTAGLAGRRIRGMLSTLAAALAQKQGLSSVPLRLAAEAGLNTLSYRPPRHRVHAVWGPAPEVGFSSTFPDGSLRWLRLSMALQLDGLDTVFSSRQTYLGLTPMAGLEVEPVFLSSAWIQPRLGARAGVLFSSGDAFSTRGCALHQETLVPCTRGVVQANMSLSLLNVVRLQVAGLWWPALRPGQAHLWAIAPTLGLQLPLGI